jgi:ABC-type transport system involved in multi-copper enzyme maturation permease subunit
VAALQRFAAILVADLRERTRGPRFWVILAAMLWLVWNCYPPIDSKYAILALSDGERGYFSSAWVGMVLAMASSVLLGLGGFYLVRGTLVRDFETRVWQLLVATPMTRAGFLLAKWASHMLVFAVILGLGLLVALVAQFVRAEDTAFHPWELVKPVLVLSVPGLAVTSMFAVWFDLIPWLRRTAGNVLYFFVWTTLIAVSVSSFKGTDPVSTDQVWRSDPDGMAMVARDFHRVRVAQTGVEHEFGFSIGLGLTKKKLERFEWQSWSPRPMDLVGRALWVLLAMLGVAAGAPLLDWAASRGIGQAALSSRAGRRLRWLDGVLAPLRRLPGGELAAAEAKLVLRQRRLWWWAAALAAFGLQIFGSKDAFAIGLLMALVLPLDILARAVLREREYGTAALTFCAPAAASRLLWARLTLCMGIVLALSLPGLVRLAATEPMAALALLAVSTAVASWGLAAGALFRNPRPFELALTVAAYVSLQKPGVFDVQSDPLHAAMVHAAAAALAWAVLAVAWPKMARM